MSRENRFLQGIPASPGIVLGRVQVLTEAAQVSSRLLYTKEDVAEELERFRQAVDQIEAELTLLKDGISGDLKEHAHILELHLLILRDRMLNSETLRLIQEENLNAERALHQAYLKIKELFQRIGDKHIRGRLADVEMVYQRLMGRLTGKDSRKPFSFKEPAIVVARDLSPAETTQMDKTQVLGFITERGGKTSHTAIIAHSLDIPAVVGLDNATLEIDSGDLLILDGITGLVILNPDDERAGLTRPGGRISRSSSRRYSWAAACPPLPATGCPLGCWPTSRCRKRWPWPPSAGPTAWDCTAPSFSICASAPCPRKRNSFRITGRWWRPWRPGW